MIRDELRIPSGKMSDEAVFLFPSSIGGACVGEDDAWKLHPCKSKRNLRVGDTRNAQLRASADKIKLPFEETRAVLERVRGHGTE